MSELSLDDRLIYVQSLSEQRARRRAKAVASRLVVREAHAPQGRQNTVVAHRSFTGAWTREQIAAVTGQGMELAQNSHRLARQRYDMIDTTQLLLLSCFVRFIRSAGIRHSAASRSNSTHSALRSSPGRTKTSGASCKAARVIGMPL